MLSVMSGVLVTGGFQVTTVGLRGLSSVFTGGLINPIISLIEDIISLSFYLHNYLPILGILIVILIALFLRKIYMRLKKKKKKFTSKIKDN